MSTRPQAPQAIDQEDYDRGYIAHFEGLKLWKRIVTLNWLNPSWRMGWTDAGKDLITSPELARKPKRKKKAKTSHD